MSKYVPRFMKDSANPIEKTEPSRWAKLDDKPVDKPYEKPLVNTSLPAKMAPKLEAKTLASATAVKPLAPIRPSRVANVTSMDDFPSLGKTVRPVQPVSTTFNFASLSRDWAQKQKEDESKAKEDADKLAIMQQFNQNAQEKEDKERSELRKQGFVSLAAFSTKKKETYEEEEENSDEPYSSDDPADDVYEEEEKEEEYGCDGVWNSRKHRDELY